MRKVVLILFSFGLWLFLTWTLGWQHLIVGGVVAIMVGLLFGNLFVHEPAKVFQFRRWFWVLIYIPRFFWEMTKANFDVAYRVLHPKMPINPGIVKVKTKLQSEMGKTFLANSITLTPGTFTLRIADDEFLVHALHESVAGGLLDGSMQRKVAAVFGESEHDPLEVHVIRDVATFRREEGL